MQAEFPHIRLIRAIRGWLPALAIAALCLTSPPVVASTRAACSAGVNDTIVARDVPYSRRLGENARQATGGVATLVFGDSIAVRWPMAQLRSVFKGDIQVFANGGDRIENTTWTVDQFNPRAATDVHDILVVVGTNNTRADDECALSAKSQTLFQHLRTRFPSARIYYVNVVQKGLPSWPMEARVLAENKIFADQAKHYSIAYVDAHAPVLQQCQSQQNCPLFSSDRVHPSPEGFKVMTDALAAVMAKR